MSQTLNSADYDSTLANPTPSDAALLSEYSDTRNPALFSELARRYTGSVYGTCLRITASVHDAEEITQDCFFELAKQAAQIHTSVAGWLHRMATNRSLNRIRSKKRRQKHEVASDTEVSVAVGRQDADPTWSDLSPILDEVIDSLPNELREAVVQHYLNGDSQSLIAEQLNVNQSTVSRRINQGLETLRDQLQKRGVTLGVSALLTLLSQNSAAAATGSAQLIGSVSKIGLLSVGGKVAMTASAKIGGMVKLAALFAAPAIAHLVAGGLFSFLIGLATVMYLLLYKPNWWIQSIVAFGGRADFLSDFDPFRRWTWTTLPPHARRYMRSGFWLGGFLLIAAIAVLTSDSSHWLGLATYPLIFGVIRLASSFRILLHLYKNPSAVVAEEVKPHEPTTILDVIQSFGYAISLLLLGMLSALMALSGFEPLYNFFFTALLGICTVSSLWEAAYKYGKYSAERAQGLPAKPVTQETVKASETTAKLLVRLVCVGVLMESICILATTIMGAGTASDSLPMLAIGVAMSTGFLTLAMKPISHMKTASEHIDSAQKLTTAWIVCSIATVGVLVYCVAVAIRIWY